MPRRSNRAFCAIVLIIGGFSAGWSQSVSVTGTVVDSASSQPISGATVAIVEYPAITATTNSSGNFTLLSAGSTASKVPFAPPAQSAKLSVRDNTLTVVPTKLPAAISVKVFSCNGVRISHAEKTARTAGGVSFHNLSLNAGISFARVRINGTEQIVSIVGGGKQGNIAGSSRACGESRSKKTAGCTLEISFPLYVTKQVVLSSTVANAATIRLAKPKGRDIVINWHDLHQTMDGFGASCQNLYSMADSLADLFFSPSKGIGLSLLRAGIASTGTMNRGYEVAQKAVARGVTVWAAPWTPPAGYKDNNDVNNGGHLLPQYYGAWAAALAAFVKTSNQNGVPLYGISIQNEPDYTGVYNSCVYTNQEMARFIDTLAPKLAALNPRPKIIMPEASLWDHTWGFWDAAAADVHAAKYTDILAFHQYYVDNPAPHALPIGKRFWETEMSSFDGPSTDIANGVLVAQWIHNAIVNAGVNAWHYWWLMCTNSDNEGILNVGGVITKRLYTIGNYSKFVRPGYVRVGVAGSQSGVLVSAFKDAASGALAIVAINTNASATGVHLVLNGVASSPVTPWVTSSSLNLAPQASVAVTNGGLTATLAATSVTTFVAP